MNKIYITFLATFLIFSILNYFIQSPNKQRTQKAI